MFDRRFFIHYNNVFQQSKVSVQTTGMECNDVTQWLMTCQESLCNKGLTSLHNNRYNDEWKKTEKSFDSHQRYYQWSFD